MAVAWPDFGAATASGREFLDALFGAIEERAAVARAAGTRVSFERPLAPGAPPTHAALLAVQLAVLALAPAFVRLGEEEDAWNKFADFPRRWSAAAVASGEHSVARLPPRGAPEGHPGSLARVRAFMSNCAWWLDRFRAVDATPRSVYTRLLEASATRHDGQGQDPNNCFGSPTVTNGEWPASRTDGTLYVVLRESRFRMDDYSGGTWHLDVNDHKDEESRGRCYCGLSVANACGLPARCLLVPAFHGTRRLPTRSESDQWLDSLARKPAGWDGYYPASWHREARSFEWRGGWRERSSDLWTGSQSAVQDQSGYGLAYVGSETHASRLTSWSADGLRSLVLDEGTSERENPGVGLATEHHETDIEDFDGCGNWTCGEPVDAGVVAPHGRIEAFERLDGIPIPDGADLAALRRMRDKHPLDYNEESITFAAGVKLVPILDYHESYARGTDPEQEP